MGQTKLIDANTLTEKAENSQDREAYKLLDKNRFYRIGVGARINSPTQPSFFIELIIKLSTGNGKVNIHHLKRMLILLEALQNAGYTLTYQDDNSISCEKTILTHEILQELGTAKSIINNNRKNVSSRNVGARLNL